MKNLLFIGLIISLRLAAQNNLVLNGSLEFWENGMPKHWEIIQESVDIFKSDYRLIPPGVSYLDTSYRSRFPSMGSDGNTYFGLHHDEIIKCRLKQSLEEEDCYQLSFWVRKPPVFNTSKVTNTFTFKLMTPTNQPQILLAKADSVVNASSTAWCKVSTVFAGFKSSDELYFGFFGDTYNSLEFGAIGLYYLFDDVQLYQGELVIDTLTLQFGPGNYNLSSQQKIRVLAAVTERVVDSLIIKGYASVIGKKDDNFTLAEKRTNAVCQLLESYDFPLRTINYGEQESKTGNEDFDRRVLLEIRYYDFKKDSPTRDIRTFDRNLAKEIGRLERADQSIRNNLEACADDSLRQVLLAELAITDSLNQRRLVEIMDSVGYPGLSVVGPAYMDAAFLLIHHSELELRLKYEPMILEAVSRGEATNSLMPYFIDRNRIDTGEKQIFGTQLYLDEETGQFKLFELAYPERVNMLRQEKGLMPIEDYVKQFNDN